MAHLAKRGRLGCPFPLHRTKAQGCTRFLKFKPDRLLIKHPWEGGNRRDGFSVGIAHLEGTKHLLFEIEPGLARSRSCESEGIPDT